MTPSMMELEEDHNSRIVGMIVDRRIRKDMPSTQFGHLQFIKTQIQYIKNQYEMLI